MNSYAKEFLLSLTELDRKQLILVEEALRRIDRGEYGRCQQCGEEINRKRLEVQPWARHCVRCQELEEQGLLPQYGATVPATRRTTTRSRRRRSRRSSPRRRRRSISRTTPSRSRTTPAAEADDEE